MSVPACLSSVLFLGLGLAAAPALTAQDRPAAVTDSLVERGSALFHGSAGCASCHGPRGLGSEAGPSLRDAEWARGRGTYEEILDLVLHGVPRSETKTGEPMPIRGVAELSDADVRAVAAYVWSLSHPRS